MSTTVFHLDRDGTLTGMPAEPHAKEGDLQALIATHCELLRLVAEPSGSLVLADREVGVDDGETAGRWSLDHLFNYGDGVLVLVEVKRAADTRARREVVAQMLDDAANGVAYWPLERLRASFCARHEAPDDVLRDVLGFDDADAFWRIAGANLTGGRIRMVFVADRIAPELKRIVEFLNEQMRPAEMLALEIARYTAGSGSEILVPRLVGATGRATIAKHDSRPSSGPTTETEFLDQLTAEAGVDAGRAAEQITRRCRERGFAVNVTKTGASIQVAFECGNKIVRPAFVERSRPRFRISLYTLATWAPYIDLPARQNVADRLRSADPEGFEWSGAMNGLLYIPARVLSRRPCPVRRLGLLIDIREQIFTAAGGEVGLPGRTHFTVPQPLPGGGRWRRRIGSSRMPRRSMWRCQPG